MSTLLMLTSALQPSAEVLPALALLPHTVRVLPAEGSALLEAPPADLILVDGDPVADISLITRPQESFLAIIKDGQLVKGADAPGGS